MNRHDVCTTSLMVLANNQSTLLHYLRIY